MEPRRLSEDYGMAGQQFWTAESIFGSIRVVLDEGLAPMEQFLAELR
jgi:hypothetical protein